MPRFIRHAVEDFNSPEPKLYREFVQIVGSLLIEELAVPYSQNPVRNISAYQFVPCIPIISRISSMEKTGHQNKTLRGIKTTYPPDPDGLPYLDTRQAIGLARNNHLLAVASAGITTADQKTTLRIVQLQNVSGIGKKQRTEYVESFLKDGIDWKKTLVGAWENAGHALGVDELSIQSFQNSFNLKTHPERGKILLDDVAREMGYTQQSPEDDWVKPVSEITPTPRSSIGLTQHLGAVAFAIS